MLSKAKIIRFSSLFICNFFLISCFSKLPRGSYTCESKTENGAITQSISEVENEINIFIDGSSSMQGYVFYNDSQYLNFLESLYKSTTFSNLNEKFNFFRLGKPTNLSNCSIANRKLCIQQIVSIKSAKLKSFYFGKSNDYPPLTSSLHPAIEPTESSSNTSKVSQSSSYHNKISIIISDLEPDDAAVEKMSAKFKPLYKRNNFSVSVLAVRSHFNGPVFYIKKDSQLSKSNFKNKKTKNFFSFNTKSEKKSKGFRPFYIIIFGDKELSSSFFSRITSILSKNNFIFHATVFDPRKSLELSTVKLQRNNVEKIYSNNNLNSINNGDLILNENENFIILNEKAAIGNSFHHVFEAKTSPHFLVPSVYSFRDLSLKSFYVHDQSIKLNSEDEIKSYFTMDNISYKNKKDSQFLTSTINLNRNRFLENKFYAIDYSIYISDFSDHAWWKSYDWSSSIGYEDGSKTYNLHAFLSQMKQISTSSINSSQNHLIKICTGLIF